MDIFEPGNTIQFTFTSSIAPDNAPSFSVYTTTSMTLVISQTAITSGATGYYSLYTIPSTDGLYVGEWVAQKTISSSAWNFKKRFVFNVKATRI